MSHLVGACLQRQRHGEPERLGDEAAVLLSESLRGTSPSDLPVSGGLLVGAGAAMAARREWIASSIPACADRLAGLRCPDIEADNPAVRCRDEQIAIFARERSQRGRVGSTS